MVGCVKLMILAYISTDKYVPGAQPSNSPDFTYHQFEASFLNTFQYDKKHIKLLIGDLLLISSKMKLRFKREKKNSFTKTC